MASSRLPSPSVAAAFHSVIAEWMPPGYSLTIAEWPAIRQVDELQQAEHARALAETANRCCLDGEPKPTEGDLSAFAEAAAAACVDGAWLNAARASALCIVIEGRVRERIGEVTAALDRITHERELALSSRAA